MKIWLRLICILAGVAVLAVSALPSLAATPHEDPAQAKPVYNAFLLFEYYTEALDLVLAKEAVDVAGRMEKMPFANLPDSLSGATASFSLSTGILAQLVVDIDRDAALVRDMLARAAYDDAVATVKKVLANLAEANEMLMTMKDAVVATGAEFRVFSLQLENSLRLAYEDILARIQMIGDLLDGYRDLLGDALHAFLSAEALERLKEGTPFPDSAVTSASSQYGTILERLKEGTPFPDSAVTSASSQYGTILERLKEGTPFPDSLTLVAAPDVLPTAITLQVAPDTAFVGESVQVSGTLTSGGDPLGNREVRIFLNGTHALTVGTGGDGRFRATLALPHWYSPEIRAQAVYSPRGADAGVYLPAASETVTLKVLYYRAIVGLMLAGRAYPGLNITVAGNISYAGPVSPVTRKVEIYLDNDLVTATSTPRDFSVTVKLSPAFPLGKHTVTVTTAADGRYAPVTVSRAIEVTKAVPELALATPRVLFIPGTLKLEGGLASDIGRVSGALVTCRLAGVEAAARSAEDGSFTTSLRMGMGFSLIGSESVEITVAPSQAWYDTITATRRLLVVNVVNCGLFFVLITAVGIVVPRRVRIRIPAYRWRRKQLAPPLAPAPVTGPEYRDTAVIPAALAEVAQESIGSRQRVLSLYLVVLRLAQRMARILVKPQQTLREFSRELQDRLGPVGEALLGFTRIVEQLLYSRYEATDDDVRASEQLSERIREGLKE